jgi:DNA-binding SARP family transcriptional activator
MTRIQFTVRMLAAALTVAALLVLLILTWGLRPPFPNLDRSPTGPPALTVAEQIVDVVAWVLAIAVIVRLLQHVAIRLVHIGLPESRAATARLQQTLSSQPVLDKRRWPLVHLATSQPFPLIVRSPDRTSPQLAVLAPSTPAAAPAVTDPRQDSTERSISILGPLKIEGARQRGRKLRSLTAQTLVYLVLHPEGATVEQLTDALLPETAPDQSRNRLWQSASEARRILGDGFRRDDDGRYQLDRVTVRIDIDELSRLLGAAQRAADSADKQKLEAALSLFRGEPLAGIDWPWAEGHARHLRATYVELLECVGRARLEAGDPRGALDAIERGLQLDQLNESIWRLAMEADRAAGLREAISQRYEQLKVLLQQQLGLEPDTETRALYHRLLGQG